MDILPIVTRVGRFWFCFIIQGFFWVVLDIVIDGVSLPTFLLFGVIFSWVFDLSACGDSLYYPCSSLGAWSSYSNMSCLVCFRLVGSSIFVCVENRSPLAVCCGILVRRIATSSYCVR